MPVLLDTHTLIWYYQGNSELSQQAQSSIKNSKGEFYTSVASFWEIAIKVGLGKLKLDSPLEIFFEDVASQGYKILPISFPHLLNYSNLPFHHRDPFDRLIIAQALSENMDLISKDEIFDEYLGENTIQRIW